MKRRMRVASLIGNLGCGGSENRLLSFARTIDKSRFDHMVITLYRREQPYEQRAGSLRDVYADCGIQLVDLGERPGRILPSKHPAAMLRAGSTLTRLVRKLCSVIRTHRIDLIDAQHAAATVCGVMAGTLTRRPATVTEYFPSYFDRPGMRLLGQAIYAGADAFICDSQAHSDLINKWMFRPHRRSLVIPNGVPTPVVHRSNEEMRRLLDIPLSARVVGQVSRLTHYKGQRVLLRAAREVLLHEPDTFFVLTGYANEDPSYRETLSRDILELGIGHRVRVVSWPGSIGDIWQVIDIHVHPSLQDSLPIAITEGMSLAKPAVVTNVGGVEEMVTHEQTGLVVPMNDPGALAREITRLLRDGETGRRLGREAQLRYQQKYRPEVMTRTLEDLFADLIEMNANGRS